MIYLAKNSRGEIERIQVVRQAIYDYGIHSYTAWGAYNYDGSNILVPFTEENKTQDRVLNILVQEYESLCVSKRLVDHLGHHIVCVEKKYSIYNDEGHFIKSYGANRITFHDNKIVIIPSTAFPDYYDQISEVQPNRLWCAKDIDTGLWCCLTKDSNVVSQSKVRENAIQEAVHKLS